MKERGKLLLIAFLGILIFAVLDIVVLEKIYHPLSAAYQIPWGEFYASSSIPLIWWHIAFVPLVFLIFGLLGWAAKSWKLFFTGSILFTTGWEDIFYYVLRGSYPPATLNWLNSNPFMVLMNLIFPGPDVTRACVITAAVIGLIAIYLIFWGREFKKMIKR